MKAKQMEVQDANTISRFTYRSYLAGLMAGLLGLSRSSSAQPLPAEATGEPRFRRRQNGDGEGYTTYTYDVNGRLTKIEYCSSCEPRTVITYDYDLERT